MNQDIIKEKIAEYQANIKTVRRMKEDLEIVESIIPGCWVWLDYEINVNWSVKDFDEVKRILHEFAKRKILLREFIKSDTQPQWFLNGLKSSIRLQPTWSREEGAACRLVQVGEKVEKYPVYKLMCDGKEVDNDSK